jgi:hypothetical protein
MGEHVVAIAGLVVLLLVWLVVQLAWRRVFPRNCPDGDALAGRGGCGGCTNDCEIRDADR